MARCASSWPRRGSCRLDFAHFRILSDLLGVLMSTLLWVESIRIRDVLKGFVPLNEEPFQRSLQLLGSSLGAGGGQVVSSRCGFMPNKWTLLGSERVAPWVTSYTMNGKGDMTGRARLQSYLG